MDNEAREYSKKIVAFLDILGFSNLVSTRDPKVHKIMQHLESKEVYLKSISQKESVESYKEHIERLISKELNILSDSITISYTIDKEFFGLAILQDLASIQLELLKMGILLRGGITVGEVYHKDGIVYGPAMIEAVKLEEEYAKYPRIIVDNDFYNLLIKSVSGGDMLNNIDKYFIKLPDYDDSLFLNYLTTNTFYTENSLNDISGDINSNDICEELRDIKNFLIKEYKKSEKNKRILDKYEWLINYFNHSIANHVIDECGQWTQMYSNLSLTENQRNELKIHL